mmetsp:Transcript_54012/g.112851  ORF Transcript_54012/g.112851 Transcript_54012/m.112851 type:complete len:142 (-) Transcript_54012:1185-1610(-)
MEMDRKKMLYEAESKLVDELDTLADQAITEKFLYKKRRLEVIQTELEQLRAAELKEKEIQLKTIEKEIEFKKMEKDVEIKKVESSTTIRLKELETEAALAKTSCAGCMQFGRRFNGSFAFLAAPYFLILRFGQIVQFQQVR